MRRIAMIAGIVVAMGALSWIASAGDEDKAEKVQLAAAQDEKESTAKEGDAKADTKEPKQITWTGEPLDLKCYLSGKKSGEGHAACAAKCAKGGASIGFLVKGEKDRVYLLLNKDAKSPVDLVVEHMGKQVKLTGTAINLGGLNLITVEKVEKVEAEA